MQRLARWRNGLGPIVVAYFCGGCVDLEPIRRDLSNLRALAERYNSQLNALEREMSEGFRLALCRPEIRQLIDDVRSECTPFVDPKSPEARKVEAMCETKKIHPAVMSADPEHKGRFLKFMSLLRHEAFYMRPKAKDIIKQRRERLEKLAALPVLRNTVFLIVVHPIPGQPDAKVEAYNRGVVILDRLLAANPDIKSDRVSIWIYSFPVGRAEIDNPIDMPNLSVGEPPDMNASVWVFRADC